MVMCNQSWDNLDWQVVTSWRSPTLLETESAVSLVGEPAEAGGARWRRDEEPHDQDTTETRTVGKDRGRERVEDDEAVLVAGEIVLVADDVGSPPDDASYLVARSRVGVLQDSWPELADSELSLV